MVHLVRVQMGPVSTALTLTLVALVCIKGIVASARCYLFAYGVTAVMAVWEGLIVAWDHAPCPSKWSLRAANAPKETMGVQCRQDAVPLARRPCWDDDDTAWAMALEVCVIIAACFCS